ncbi:unnamed protein product, partial [Meganyctiphanes norvegica]
VLLRGKDVCCEMAPRGFMAYFRMVLSVVSCVLYLIEVGTGINAAHQHYLNGHVLWWTLTLVSILLPMAVKVIVGIYYGIRNSGWSVRNKCLCVVVFICGTPMVPFILLVLGVVASVNGYDLDGPAVRNAEYVKLLVAMLQSFPQYIIQIYVIANTCHGGIGVEGWELASVVSSLISQAFFVTTSYNVLNEGFMMILLVLMEPFRVFKKWFKMALGVLIPWFKKVWSIMSIALYLLDIGTDINAAYQYYTNPHYLFGTVYGELTIAFILLPLVATSIAELCATNSSEESMLRACLWVASVICLSPIVPLYYLIQAAIASFRGNDPNGNAARAAGLIKLTEIMLEAFPQACTQIFIIMVQISGGESVAGWQWATFVTSIISIGFNVSTSLYLFDNAPSSSRLVFFFFGLMATTSRLLLSGAGLPIISVLVASVSIWLIKRICKCCDCAVPLASVHHSSDRLSTVHVLISWMLAAIYNCFTLTGLLMSTLTLIWSVVPIILMSESNQSASTETNDEYIVFMIAHILSVITFITNILLVAVPQLRHIGVQWLSIDEHGGSRQY